MADPVDPRPPTLGPIVESGTDPPVLRVERVDLLGGLLSTRPIVDGDYADPFALSLEEANYVYATNTVAAHVPVLRFPAGRPGIAQVLGDALPELPEWTTPGFQWAPSVWRRPDGTYVLYYATPAPGGSPRQCISRATSKDPAGPFRDDSEGPMICPLELGGAIDPSPVLDGDGTPHLLWKSDGNCCGLPTVIYSQPLSEDGLSTDGPAVALIDASEPWEGGLVEAPSMAPDDDGNWLFYSANNWDSDSYAIGAARCESVSGPCTKVSTEPWMRSAGSSYGPGGQEMFDTGDELWMVHHGWLAGQAGTTGGQRRLYLDRVTLRGEEVPQRSGAQAAVEVVATGALITGLLIGLVLLALVHWRHRRRAARVGRGG